MINGESLMEYISDTTPKYESMAGELVPFLLDFLRESNKLERKMAEKSFQLEESRRKPGARVGGNPEETKALFKEYKELFYEIAKDKCTEKLLSRGYAVSFGGNGKYGYVDKEFQLKFTMKSAKKAVIETHFHKGYGETKHQFTLKLTDDGWRINERKYSYDDETVWYKDKM